MLKFVLGEGADIGKRPEIGTSLQGKENTMFTKGFIRVLILAIALALAFCFSTEGFGQPRKRKSAVEEEKRKEDREKPAVRPQQRREPPPPQRRVVRPRPSRRHPGRHVVRRPHRHHVPTYGEFHRSIPRHSTIRWKGREYFYHRDRGVFYDRRGAGFVIVRPPFGIVVPFLPPPFVPFFFGGIAYYYFGDVFYRRVPSGYVVVQAPHVLVRAYILNVRSGPGMQHPVISEVYEGELLVIYGHAPGWLYVQLPDGSYGWVSQKFTEPVAPVRSG